MIDTALLRQIVANLEHHIRPDWLHEITAAADHIEKQEQAITAAREALEVCANDQCAVTKYDGIGNESHDDAPVTGCDCWACERTRRVRAALAALKGEQP